MSDTALLIIDVQAGMFSEGELPYQSEQLLTNLNHLIDQARSSQTPIIYIQHGNRAGSSLEPGTPGWEIHPAIAPSVSDTVVQKRFPDAFQATTLQKELTERGIKKLIVAGMQTEFCVDTTCRRAFSLDYDVTLVQDAHSTWNTPIATAEKIIAHHNAVLGDWFVQLRPTSEILLAERLA
ncbi:cysteine hydrolase family protein [soil metagenome]